MGNVNLLKETRQALKESSKKKSDILAIVILEGGGKAKTVDWAQLDYNYDSGFGSAEVDEGLVIYFKDGSSLTRWEYDGSEGWEYQEAFGDLEIVGKANSVERIPFWKRGDISG